MASPSEFCNDVNLFAAGHVHTVQNFKADDTNLNRDSKYGTKSPKWKRFQFLGVSAVQGRRLTFVEESREKHCLFKPARHLNKGIIILNRC